MAEKDFYPTSAKRLLSLSGEMPLSGETVVGFGEGRFLGLVAAVPLAAGDGCSGIHISDVTKVALTDLIGGDANLHSVNSRQLRLVILDLEAQSLPLFLYRRPHQIAPLGP